MSVNKGLWKSFKFNIPGLYNGIIAVHQIDSQEIKQSNYISNTNISTNYHLPFSINYSGDTCPWRLHTSIITDAEDGSFEVKILNDEHNCLSIQYLGHRQASTSFLARQLQAKIRDHPTNPLKEIAQDVCREFGITIPYRQAHRTKEATKQMINDSDEDAYKSLPKYCEDLDCNNPESKIVLESIAEEGVNRFS